MEYNICTDKLPSAARNYCSYVATFPMSKVICTCLSPATKPFLVAITRQINVSVNATYTICDHLCQPVMAQLMITEYIAIYIANHTIVKIIVSIQLLARVINHLPDDSIFGHP